MLLKVKSAQAQYSCDTALTAVMAFSSTAAWSSVKIYHSTTPVNDHF
jgi:hypothetical protein